MQRIHTRQYNLYAECVLCFSSLFAHTHVYNFFVEKVKLVCSLCQKRNCKVVAVKYVYLLNNFFAVKITRETAP